MKATASIFSIDGTTPFKGFTFGQTWNGWACPYFELGTALEIAELVSLPGEGFTISYNAITGALTVVEQGETYEVPAQIINTENGLKTVYALGACGWVWEDHAWHNA